MPKSFIRIVAFLLVPCLAGNALLPAGAATFQKQEAALMADPATASTLINPLCSRQETRVGLFTWQALAPRPAGVPERRGTLDAASHVNHMIELVRESNPETGVSRRSFLKGLGTALGATIPSKYLSLVSATPQQNSIDPLEVQAREAIKRVVQHLKKGWSHTPEAVEIIDHAEKLLQGVHIQEGHGYGIQIVETLGGVGFARVKDPPDRIIEIARDRSSDLSPEEREAQMAHELFHWTKLQQDRFHRRIQLKTEVSDLQILNSDENSHKFMETLSIEVQNELEARNFDIRYRTAMAREVGQTLEQFYTARMNKVAPLEARMYRGMLGFLVNGLTLDQDRTRLLVFSQKFSRYIPVLTLIASRHHISISTQEDLDRWLLSWLKDPAFYNPAKKSSAMPAAPASSSAGTAPQPLKIGSGAAAPKKSDSKIPLILIPLILGAASVLDRFIGVRTAMPVQGLDLSPFGHVLTWIMGGLFGSWLWSLFRSKQQLPTARRDEPAASAVDALSTPANAKTEENRATTQPSFYAAAPKQSNNETFTFRMLVFAGMFAGMIAGPKAFLPLIAVGLGVYFWRERLIIQSDRDEELAPSSLAPQESFAHVRLQMESEKDKERLRSLLVRSAAKIPDTHKAMLREINGDSGAHRGGAARGHTASLNMKLKDEKFEEAFVHELGHIVHLDPSVKAIWEATNPYPIFYKLMWGISFALVPIIYWIAKHSFLSTGLAYIISFVWFFLGLSFQVAAGGFLNVILLRYGAPFVSDYAMVNIFEDFAETYEFYANHQDEFRAKSLQNLDLRQKYEAMQKIFGHAPDLPAAAPKPTPNMFFYRVAKAMRIPERWAQPMGWVGLLTLEIPGLLWLTQSDWLHLFGQTWPTQYLDLPSVIPSVVFGLLMTGFVGLHNLFEWTEPGHPQRDLRSFWNQWKVFLPYALLAAPLSEDFSPSTIALMMITVAVFHVRFDRRELARGPLFARARQLATIYAASHDLMDYGRYLEAEFEARTRQTARRAA